MFWIADQHNKTIEEFLFGNRGELSVLEYTYWKAFYKEKARVEQEASDPKRTTKTQQFKKTMGGGVNPM